jgi:hypothetical protein
MMMAGGGAITSFFALLFLPIHFYRHEKYPTQIPHPGHGSLFWFP